MTSIIKRLRAKQNVFLEDLAEALGMTRQTLAKVEKGESELSISQAKKASEFFEVPIESIIENKMPQELQINIIPSEKKQVDEKEEIRIDIPEENINKFKEVLLYILEKVGAKPNVGQTVLYKLLYFIDFDFYEKNEKQLMGNIYIKNTFGPTPVAFAKIIKEMSDNQDLEEVNSKFYGKQQRKYLPIRNANLELLNAQEIKHIENVLERLSDLTANQISDYSHKDVPWIITEEGKPIPYESVFYRTPETSVRNYEE